MIGLPIVLYPLMMIGSSQLFLSQIDKVQKSVSKVVVLGAPEGEIVFARLTAMPGIELFAAEVLRPPVSGARPEPAVSDQTASECRGPSSSASSQLPADFSTEEIATALRAEKVHAVLVIESGFDSCIKGNGVGRLKLYTDDASELSESAGEKVRSALGVLNDKIAEDRLSSLGYSKDLVNPLCIIAQNTASPERMGGNVAGRFLPYVLILMILMGAMYPAMDLTAGEKERKTMETLLVSPATRLELVTGKYVAIFIIALVCAVLNLASLAVSIARVLPSDQLAPGVPGAAPAISFSISPWTILGFVVFMIPVAGLFAGLTLAVSSFARTYKEAQLYITPLVLLTIMPAMISMLPGVELTYGLSLVPIANVTLLFREVLSQESITIPRVIMMSLVFLSTAAYAYLALRIAAWIFTGEGILLPSPNAPRLNLRLTVQFARVRKGVLLPQMSIEQALLLLAAVFLLQFYASPYFLKQGLLTGLLVTQLGLILLPTLLFVFLFRISLRTGLGISYPGLKAIGAGLLCGLLAFLAATSFLSIQSLVFPLPDFHLVHFKELLLAECPCDFFVVVGLVAMVTPFCEELLFRGAFLRACEARFGTGVALIASGLIFSLFHVDIYRVIPLSVVGVAAAGVCLATRSILPAIAVHAANNGIVALLAYGATRGDIPESFSLSVLEALVVLLVSCFALWWLLVRIRPAGPG
jgi:sodium transport system permease protein